MNRAVKLSLGLEIVDVVQRQRRDHRIGAGQRVEKAALLERDPLPVARQPPAGLAEHVPIDIQDGDADSGKPVEHGG